MNDIYLITHASDCGCRDRTPHTAETPDALARYLRGRDMLLHTVYVGECPYRFLAGDPTVLDKILREFPPATVRPYLPVTLMFPHAGGSWYPVCIIGDKPDA